METVTRRRREEEKRDKKKKQSREREVYTRYKTWLLA